MPSDPAPQNKARAEIVPVVAVDTDGRFARLDFGSPTLGERALAGQFFEVSCRAQDGGGSQGGSLLTPLLNRPFSLHRWIDGGFSILFEVVGLGTQRLAALRASQRVLVIGPLGRGMQEIPAGITRLVLVAGGTGIAAFPAFAQLSARRDVRCWLYYGVNTGADVAFRREGSASQPSLLLDEFDALGCRWSLASMHDRSFFPGTVVDLLERDRREGREPFEKSHKEILLIGCGPRAMLRALAVWSAERNLRCYLLLEEMMGCGFGICRSCAVPGFQITEDGKKIRRNLAVCRDGPMIEAERIDWEMDWS
jgi:NAD(P)H-flavin reductase